MLAFATSFEVKTVVAPNDKIVFSKLANSAGVACANALACESSASNSIKLETALPIANVTAPPNANNPTPAVVRPLAFRAAPFATVAILLIAIFALFMPATKPLEFAVSSTDTGGSAILTPNP